MQFISIILGKFGRVKEEERLKQAKMDRQFQMELGAMGQGFGDAQGYGPGSHHGFQGYNSPPPAYPMTSPRMQQQMMSPRQQMGGYPGSNPHQGYGGSVPPPFAYNHQSGSQHHLGGTPSALYPGQMAPPMPERDPYGYPGSAAGHMPMAPAQRYE